MFEGQPHKAAFMQLMHDERDSAHFMFGYLVGHIDDELLCRAIQAWRGHVARLADLEAEKMAPSGSAVYDPRD